MLTNSQIICSSTLQRQKYSWEGIYGLKNKLTATAALLAASYAFGSVAYADVCDTPSKLGDMGSFPGEVITMQGSMLGTDQEMLLNTVSCFEKATGAKIQYSGSRDFAALSCS